MDPVSTRTFYVFPPDLAEGLWYQVEMPIAQSFAEELAQSNHRAWHALIGVMEKLIARSAASS